MIPIRNLFTMLAFCWRDMGLIDAGPLGACNFERPSNVAAHLLSSALTRLFRRGLAVEFVTIEEAAPQPRGAIDLARTIRERLPDRGQLAFRVDDLTEDTAPNRLIKAALAVLMRSAGIDAPTRVLLRRHFGHLASVALLTPQEAVQLRVRAPRHERIYQEAIWLARLTLECLLPDEGAHGDGRSRALRLEERMPLLFQGFIRGAATHFLQGQARVTAPTLQWQLDRASARAQVLVPIMRTDVHITHGDGARALLECKFYEAPLACAAFGDDERFHIAHLYQIVTYVNALARAGPRPCATIVYGSPGGAALDETMQLEETELRIAWIDLAADWPNLRRQVVDVVAWRGLRSGSAAA